MMSSGFILGEEARRDIGLYYDISKNELGKGSYGTVTLATIRGTNIRRAVKMIEKSRVSNAERFKLEVEIMMRLDHPNILRLYDYFEEKNFVYLVLELCTGGELFDKIIANKYYDEEEGRLLFKQILRAIFYCHQNGVCHRDLKPENFIMVSTKDPYTLKVIDFGLSRTFVSETTSLTGVDPRLAALPGSPMNSPMSSPMSSPMGSPARARRQTKAILKTKAGTPFYIAPEVLDGNYTEKCDVWSAGVILYVIFCGYPPFYGESNRQILQAVKQGRLEFKTAEWRDKSSLAIDLIKKMVTPHERRLFADEALRHAFMTGKPVQVEKKRVQQILTNMQEFARLQLGKKLLIYFIARNLYEEQLVPMHEYFHHFDRESCGAIGLESFRETLKAAGEGNERKITELFAALDVFDQKAIPYSLFIASAFALSQFFNEPRLHLLFLLMDIDRSDSLSRQDVERFLQVQFKHRPNVPERIKAETLQQFAELKLIGCGFKEFLANVTK